LHRLHRKYLGGRNLRVNDLRTTIIAEPRRAIQQEFDDITAIHRTMIAAIRPSMIVVQMIRGRSRTLRAKVICSDSKPVQFKYKINHQGGRCAMARLDSGYLPRENPCAQCGKPISRPDWIESNAGRTSFLWYCHACDYRFEAIAIYEESHPDSLAA
jgi:hypothetical protein